jgi:hypothetical protein
LKKNKNQQPKTSHRQLAEITGVPKSTIVCVIQQQGKMGDGQTLCHKKQGTSKNLKLEANL